MQSDRPGARSAIAATLGVFLAGAHCGDGEAAKTSGELTREDACTRLLVADDVHRARRNCELCLEFNARNAECLNQMGIVELAEGKRDAARESFRHAIRENNDMAQARSNLGKMALDDGDYQEAIALFTSAIEIDPDYASGRYNLANAWLHTALVEQARGADPAPAFDHAQAEYERLAEVEPNRVELWRDLGFLAATRDDAAAAERHDRRCIALAPPAGADAKACHGNLAHLLLALHRDNEAAAEARACLAVDPAERVCQDDLAAALRSAGVDQNSSAPKSAAPSP